MGAGVCICCSQRANQPALSTEDRERALVVSKINARKAKKVPRLDVTANRLYKKRKGRVAV